MEVKRAFETRLMSRSNGHREVSELKMKSPGVGSLSRKYETKEKIEELRDMEGISSSRLN